MTTATATLPGVANRRSQGRSPRGVLRTRAGEDAARVGRAAPGGESTLDEVVVDAWEGLASARAVACPVCGGEMSPQPGIGAGELGGSCADCGAELS